jgi:hypothetical protein
MPHHLSVIVVPGLAIMLVFIAGFLLDKDLLTSVTAGLIGGYLIAKRFFLRK